MTWLLKTPLKKLLFVPKSPLKKLSVCKRSGDMEGMNFVITKNPKVIEDLKQKKYQVIMAKSNGEYVFLNNPPLENKFSDKDEVLFTNIVKF